MDQRRLEGKVAIITGGGSGLGRAGAILLAQEGAKVVVCGRDEGKLQETAAQTSKVGERAIAVKADVSSPPDVEGLVRAALAAYGRVDILWNNAGVLQESGARPVEAISVEDWDQVVDINLKGVFLGCKYVVPHMKKQGSGSIVSTVSVAGIKNLSPGLAAYSASKGGVIAMTKTLAVELGPHNIRVNCICPGLMMTPMTYRPGRPGTPPNLPPGAAVTDANRNAEPIEVARMVLHMVSDESGPLTGAVITLDGGLSVR